MNLLKTLLFLLLLPNICYAESIYTNNNENNALSIAAIDIQTLPIEDRYYIRYIWITRPVTEELQATTSTLNYISHASVPLRPLPIGNKEILLLRIDLRAYAPQEDDLKNLIKTWENFQYDPKFNLLITQQTAKFLNITVKKEVYEVPEFTHTDGKKYNHRERDALITRIVSEHIDKNAIATLIDNTKSQAPIVNHDYFITRSLTSIQDKGVFKIIYGGLYYDFLGFRIKSNPKKTDEDNLLERLGIKDGAQVFDKLRSDQRVAVFRSGVTGKPRRVDFLRTLASRESQGILSITHDVKDQDIDIDTHAIMNLLNFKDRAREVIYENLIGYHSFALFDDEGALQDEVPPDIAVDYTIPIPKGTRLQPAISCIRCHKTGNGWQPIKNDVKQLLAGYIDVFNDKPNKKFSDVIDRLAGLYAGNPEQKLLPRGRDDYAQAILRATGPWEKSKDQTDITILMTDKLSEIYKSYVFDVITPEKAIIELGINPKHKLTDLLKPENIIIDGIIPEDPRIGALLRGIPINRTEWDLIYSFVAARIHKRQT